MELGERRSGTTRGSDDGCCFLHGRGAKNNHVHFERADVDALAGIGPGSKRVGCHPQPSRRLHRRIGASGLPKPKGPAPASPRASELVPPHPTTAAVPFQIVDSIRLAVRLIQSVGIDRVAIFPQAKGPVRGSRSGNLRCCPSAHHKPVARRRRRNSIFDNCMGAGLFRFSSRRKRKKN